MIRMNMGRDILCLFFYSVFTEGSFFFCSFLFLCVAYHRLTFLVGVVAGSFCASCCMVWNLASMFLV